MANYLRASTDTTVKRSVLDELMTNVWNQKPVADAVNDIQVGSKNAKLVHSNLLSFPCRNSFITNTDFYNVYPIVRERIYNLDTNDGIKFIAIKKRHPKTLEFMDHYYLLFASYVDACVYYLETANKVINGIPMTLQFAPITANLPYMASPIYHRDYQGGDVDTNNPFTSIPSKHDLFTQIPNQSINDNYESIASLIDYKSRQCSVWVKNLPFGIDNRNLLRLLWDYTFPPDIPLSNCIKTVHADALRQVNINLITFGTPQDAKRFVQTFHGQKWYQHQTSSITKLYEPVKCQVLA